MDAISDPSIPEVSVQASSQVGKTELELNAVGYFMEHDPAPMLMIQPTIEMGMAWSKDRLATMLRDTPSLHGLVSDARAKSSSNTILHKSFRGGHLTIAGANSPASLASRPVRFVLQDEVDRFAASAGSEGDPCSLADKRSSTFWNRKLVKVSTPTVEGVSRIQAVFESSDQRYFHVPCPKCGEFQPLVWAQVKFDKTDAERSTRYVCIKCNGNLGEIDKYRMVRKGVWRATYPERCLHAGFHINELYSPWSTWRKIVVDFLDKKQRQETLRVWINTTLGECWREEESYSIDTDALAARRETYVDAPGPVCILTAGIDVQDDRLECVVKGWGVKEESWYIERKVFYGSPGRPDTWALLDDYLATDFPHEYGVKLRVSSVCVDSGGHYSQAVYQYTRKRQGRRYFSTKGYGGFGRPFIGKPSKNNKQRAIVVPLGVDAGKEMLYDRLKSDPPGPGTLHFNEACDEDYFLQLTAEKCVVKHSKGFPTRVWMLKDKRRNEMLDCEVLNMAAFLLLNANMEKLAREMDARAGDHPEVEDTDAEQSSSKVETPIRKPSQRHRKSFIKNW